MRRLIAWPWLNLGLASLLLAGCAAPAARVSLNPAVRHQTMSGWEAVAQAGQLECPGFAAYAPELLARSADELGINRLRLELRSGAENPVDAFAAFRAGQRSFGAWAADWYVAVNDNGDPFAVNPAGFHFSELDDTVQRVVEPLRQRLAARGEALYVNLAVVAFDHAGRSSLRYDTQPEEYAELLLAAFQHLERAYGWVPDGVEVILEPDVAGWPGGTAVGRALAAAGRRLQAAGYRPDFIAPSTTHMGRAARWLDDILAEPGAADYLTEVAYHRYRGVSDLNLAAVADGAAAAGLRTAMLEHIGSGHEALFADLTRGRVSAWQQFALAFCGPDDSGAYYVVDPADGAVRMGARTPYLQQVFRFVRRGAVRIDARSSDGRFAPVAFVQPDGAFVVIVKAARGGAIAIDGLPAGTYGIQYTTDAAPMQAQPAIQLPPRQTLSTSIPHAGVITIVAQPAPASGER